MNNIEMCQIDKNIQINDLIDLNLNHKFVQYDQSITKTNTRL